MRVISKPISERLTQIELTDHDILVIERALNKDSSEGNYAVWDPFDDLVMHLGLTKLEDAVED